MASPASFVLSFPEPDIAVLTMDTPGTGANILSSSVLMELSGHLDRLESRSDLAGLIIMSGKPGIFIAGADLREFVASLDLPTEQVVAMCRRGQTLFARLSRTPFVSVAAIDGICVGGGAELAAWCDRRVLSTNPKTEFGFPEVKLGLFPGWGGTARSPRIVGLGNAVQMITSGESCRADEAGLMGWASDVVPSDRLRDAAIALVRAEQVSGQFRDDRQRWQDRTVFDETELAFLGATASAYIQQQTKGQYPAPLAALEVLLGAVGSDLESACQQEAEGMGPLFGSPINRALLNVFFLTDRNKKDRGIERSDISGTLPTPVSVLGAGIMGCGIAAANVRRQLPVSITDASPAALQHGVKRILEEVAYDRQTKKADVQRALEMAPLVNATTADAELAASDLVIEAVIEDGAIKQQLYARLEAQLSPTAILATNTSTIPIGRLSQSLQRPERFCGIHFFNPVRKMKLVEVIRGPRTSDATVASAVAYAKHIGKFPIVVQDGPGFLVNRLLFPYMNEALRLVSDGVPIAKIERAAKRFGMPMGPIELYDMVGIDTAKYAGETLLAAFPDRVHSSPILPCLVEAGRLGQKSGRGFYSYENKRQRAQADPTLVPLLQPFVAATEPEMRSETITHRLMLTMFLEATRMLQEGLVRDPRDIDLALIFGIGFPPFLGGLMYWADTMGAQRILDLLQPFSGLGPQYQPTERLRQMASRGETFYGESPKP